MDYIINRLKEASTWQGIITFLAGAAHFTLPEDVSTSITTVAVFLVGLLFVTRKESKSDDAVVSPAAVAKGKQA
jgi:hypothetical protein